MILKAVSSNKSLTSHRLRPALDVAAVCALVMSGLVLSPGTPIASAELAAPQLLSLRLDPPTAYVEFTDRSDNENRISITIRERNNPDRVVAQGEVPGIEGSGRTATRNIGNIPSGIPLCATVSAQRWGDDGISFPLNNEFTRVLDESPQSNTVCTDPANAPSDLALQNIRGNVNPQASASPAYLVEFRNNGADATGVVLDVSTSGVATLGDQAPVAGGWSANGFTCSPRAPAGGETSALSCTGGNLKKGEQTNPAVIVRFTGPGLGTIHGQISGAGDTSAGNNGAALSVTAQR